MSAAYAPTDFNSWSVEGHVPRIEYAVPVLEEICADAVDGLYRFRHGGIEIGGVLFGEADGDLVRIVAYRPLECEHAFGPRFVLSDRDRTSLKDLLYAGRKDAQLRDVEPVGWYHSHTRSPIELSPRDLEIYDSYFPQRWQVALVIRPDHYGPANAGFFFRERDNTVRTDAAYEELVIRARRHRASRVEVSETEPEPAAADSKSPAEVAFVPRIIMPEAPAPQPALVEPASIEPELREGEPVESEPGESEPGEPEPGEPEPGEPARVEAATEAPRWVLEPETPSPVVDQEELELPSFARAEPRRSRKWLWAAIAVAPLVAAAFGVAQYYRASGPPPPMSLWVADVGGQLLIEWDRTARPIRQAQSGMIEIRDGKDVTKIPIDGERLRDGSVDYVRRTDVVDVRLRVANHGRVAEEFIRFVGPPIRRGPSPEEVALQAQVASLQAQLEDQKARARAARRATPATPPRP
jgi:proteasome lid subunit RPN8/RPN11